MQNVVGEIVALAKGTSLKIAGSTPATTHDATHLGRMLFHLNHLALHAAYGEPIPAGCGSFFFAPALLDRSRVVRLKAMQCLRYQCSEGDVPDSKLFAELNAFVGLSAEAIVREIPAYKATPWAGR